METHTFYCPKCGRELMVPFDTDTFYCTYCAAPLQMENGTLHARLSDSEPTHQEQNPIKPNRKCIIFYLLSFAAAVIIPIFGDFLFGSKFVFGGHVLTLPALITMLVTGILLARTVPFRERNHQDILGKTALALTFWILEIFLADFIIRLVSMSRRY